MKKPLAFSSRTAQNGAISAIALLAAAIVLMPLPQAQAGSATWSGNPITNDWNTATNWTPNTVPDSGSDVANFDVSDQTEVSLSTSIVVDSVSFNSGASPFTILLDHSLRLTSHGGGISNNSGVLQTFVSQAPSSEFSFTNSASAGGLTVFVNHGSIDGSTSHGATTFEDSSTAGNAVFINNPGGIAGGSTNFSNFSDAGTASFTCHGGSDSGGGFVLFQNSSSAANASFLLEGASGTYSGSGEVYFENSATAGQASFTLEGGVANGSAGGQVIFFDSSTAGEASFVVNGSDVAGAKGAALEFLPGTSAGTATAIVNGGSAAGGICSLGSRSDGSAARFEIFDNGTLSIVSNGQVTVGSIEGDGIINLNLSNVFVGTANLSTTFAGTIGPIGAFHKVGAGTLTLTGANTYDGGTFVDAGLLIIANRNGSGTGPGPVSVSVGTLGGGGIIGGTVTVGTGSGTGAFLAPAAGSKKQATLTIQSALTFNADATYTCTFKAKRNKELSDQVSANGTTIKSGATIDLSGQTRGRLRAGLSLTLLRNTSANPISGTFSNLPEGAIVTINGNNFQASYTGGDGNDLTLTVVP